MLEAQQRRVPRDPLAGEGGPAGPCPALAVPAVPASAAVDAVSCGGSASIMMVAAPGTLCQPGGLLLP